MDTEATPVFLFTDIEGSTHLWEIHGRAMGDALSQHDAILTHCITAHGGRLIKHTGDGVFAVFEDGDPLTCALTIQRRLRAADWKTIGRISVRIALHTGDAEQREEDFFGSAVNRTARLLGAAWGGQILISDEVAQEWSVPEGAFLEDHGVHMLKDLGHPQHIYSLVPSEMASERYPPLRSLSTRSHNLPPQPTPFVGRMEELAEVADRLDQPSCRLLTIVGSGGIGKTRLALQVGAEKIDAFSHGIFQVPLAPLSSVEYIYATMADALRYPFSGSEPPSRQLLTYLREKELLLILDNFEHLMDATGVVARILDGAPRVKILVTSRERLNLREEWTYELRGLPVPNVRAPNGIEEYGSVRLFMQNATRVYPDFELEQEDRLHVARIVNLVEGIPLGIELASAWVRVLSCREIAQEIEESRDFLATTAPNVPQRHKSLRAVFENSWQLLSSPERKVLRRLSIFRGGFQREAAQEVAGASLSQLLSLSDKSLIRRTSTGRYEILETLRQYAEEKLYQHPEDRQVAVTRHYRYYADRLYHFTSEHGPEEKQQVLQALEPESENVRMAWREATDRQDYQAIGKALDGLYRLYEGRGWFQEGTAIFDRGVQSIHRPPESADVERLLGMLLSRRGWFAFRLGLYEESRHDLAASLEIARRLDIPREVAFSLYNQGIFAYQLGRYEKANALLIESLAIRREIGDRFGTARSMSILGIVARDQGQLDRAHELLSESLRLHREVGEARGVSRCLNLLGLIHNDTGEKARARELLEESLAISREIGDRRDIAFALSILGAIMYEMGDYGQAREVTLESLAIREEIGEQRGIAFSLHDLGNIARALEHYDRAWDCLLAALKIAKAIKAVPLALYILTGIADLLAAQGHQRQALRLATFVLRHSSSFEMAIARAEQISLDLSPRLGAQSVAEAERSVQAMDLDEVIDGLLDRGRDSTAGLSENA